ncbi:MAG: translation elongation factor Ts [Candidatus Nanopelagicaceae bacterium]
MSISASQVKELREMTGVGMMECKKALVETDGDLEKAVDLLRSNSALKAEKKASRVAADGMLVIHQDQASVSAVEINTETDFAAKDEKFQAFCKNIKDHLAKNAINNIEELNEAFASEREALVQAIGENIQIRRMVKISDGASIGTYLHTDGKLAAIVSIDSNDNELAKDLAMHVAASNPNCVTADQVDQELIARERAIYEAQAAESGKDPSIMEKMIEGKLNRFLSEITLVSQPFVKNPDQTVQALLSEKSASVLSMSRIKVGEGIEVEKKDFAAEVAEQLQS